MVNEPSNRNKGHCEDTVAKFSGGVLGEMQAPWAECCRFIFHLGLEDAGMAIGRFAGRKGMLQKSPCAKQVVESGVLV
jgi:hypothetical protein